jgi:uncharacterized membrane protein YhaH (DUF805 family)
VSVETQSGAGPLGYWTGCYRKYATFEGRARRAEYWWYSLFNLIVYLVLIAFGFLIGSSDGSNTVLGGLVGVFILAVFLPTLAVTCRRLHDIGLSGWWQLVGIIPLGGLAVFIMTVLDGNSGPNKYGPDPR